MTWGNNVFPLVIVYSTTGTPTGLFVYSPTPGPGNLIASITNSATDPYGNATASVIAAYQPGIPATNVQMQAGAVKFNQSGTTGPAVIGSNNAGVLILTSGTTASNAQSCILELVPVAAGQSGLIIAEGVIELTEAVLPAAIGGIGAGPQLLGSQSTGMVRFVSDALNGDSNTYDTGRQSLFTSSSQLINSTTQTPITGLTFAVAANVTYRVSGAITWVQGGTADNQALGITGPALSNCRITFGWWVLSQTGQSIFGSQLTAQNTRGGPGGSFAAGVTVITYIDGLFTTSASGTFNFCGSEITSGHTWTVQNYSYIDVMPVG